MIAHVVRGSLVVLTVFFLGLGRITAQEDFLRGDANSDGEVTISDSLAMFLRLFEGLPLPDCPDAQDVNADGTANLADPINLLVYLFSDGPPPPEPFELPDFEPSVLGCFEYGTGSPIEDPGAQLVVLSTEVGSGRASIVLGASHSSPIGGHSFSLRLPAEILADAEPLGFDLSGASTDTQFTHGRWEGEGTYTHGFLYSMVPAQPIPESLEVVPIWRLVVCLREGAAAGEYPVELVAGEFADATWGQAIKPTLVSGTLRLDAHVAATGDCTPPTETPPYEFRFEFGTYIPDTPALGSPMSIAADSSGRVILGTRFPEEPTSVHDPEGDFLFHLFAGAVSRIAVDSSDRIIIGTMNSRTQVYDQDGHFLFVVGSGWEFAIDSEDRIIDPDEENHRVQVFDWDGTFLFQFGELGSGDGQFHMGHTDIAVDSQDRIIIADAGGSRVQVFDSEGQFLFKLDQLRSGFPPWVVVDNLDRILVPNRGSGHVQVFDANGQLLFDLGGIGAGDGEFSKLSSVTVDSLGRIIVADDYPNLRVQVLEENGEFDFEFGTEGLGSGQFAGHHGEYFQTVKVAVDNRDRIIVTDWNPNRAQVFDPEGNFLYELGRREPRDGELRFPEAVAVDTSGRIVVAAENRIHVFDAEAEFLFKFGQTGSADGEFWGHTGLATDSKDRIVVADASNHRVQVFDPDGNFLFKFGREGDGDGEFWYARDVAVDSADRIVVVDNRPPTDRLTLLPEDPNNRIQMFDSEGTFLFKFGVGAFQGPPTAVAVDGLDRIIVAAPFPDHHVRVFDSTGSFLFKFGGQGKLNPQGIAIDSQNRIMALDGGNGVEVFDSEGVRVGRFADKYSVGPGALSGWALDVAVDGEDGILVADTGANRIVVYARKGGMLPGDCNGDGNLDLSDGVCLLRSLFEANPAELPCGDGTLQSSGNTELLDANGDRVVNISDGAAVFNFLFAGGPPPVLGTDCVAMVECPQLCDS